MSAHPSQRTPAAGRGCALLFGEDAIAMVRAWGSFLGACDLGGRDLGVVMRQLARWWCADTGTGGR